MRRKITFLLTFLVAVLSIIMAGGRVYADTGYEVEDYANQDFCYVNPDTGYEAVIVDDAAVKSIHIKRALQFCGVENIVMFDHQEALWEYLETNEADLIVTDMHYPLAKGEKENEEAGFILLEKMKQREHPIPVIICSSQNYRSPDALGTVWYNKLRDIEFDFKEILENTNWDQFQR